MMSPADLKQKTIAVLQGGMSAEREVSLRTGAAAASALMARGYRIVSIDADRDLPRRLIDEKIDIAFICLHGRNGEDGRVQGLLELLQIPYTGSGVLASSLMIDKVATKEALLYHRFVTPDFRVIRRGESVEAFVATVVNGPKVVKPSREGSTIGISVAHNQDALRAGLEQAMALDRTVVVEEFVDGAELTVSVLNGRALPIIQIVPRGGFYDYRAKYTAGQTEYLLPAPIADDLTSEIQSVSEQIYRALGCRGAVRVDYMLKEKSFYCLEVNTIPGMTETSLLPKAAQAAGLTFGDLVEQILLDADLDK